MVNLVLGTGPAVGGPLVESPLVDLVSFTGGLDTGRAIIRAAATTVKKVSVELGGKNPNIVFADTDFETVVDNALTAVFLHAGQVCSAGARLLVEDPIHDAVVAALGERAERIVLGSGLQEGTESGPLVSAAQRERTERYVASALAEGARLVAGGRRPEEAELQAGFFYRPTVLADCTREMTVVREETFGPILTVERFTTEEEAIALGNDTEYGLAGAVWTGDAARAERVARALRARHGLDQRLPPLRAAGGVGRVQAVGERPGARPLGSRRVPGDQAHLAQHGAGAGGVVHPLTVGTPGQPTGMSVPLRGDAQRVISR